MNKYNAIRINQPFGDFFVISMSAYELLKLTFSDPLRYDEYGDLKGSQRKIREDRIKEISEYIKGNDVAFPNSIIISANYLEDGTLCDDNKKRWAIECEDGCTYLRIPSSDKMASIIDGQHRVNGFKTVCLERQKEIQLLVCVYFDLPNPLQAYIFATINYNQKSVDRSLALEQWGFSLQTDDPKSWSPEMLAVFLSKRLNTERDSPFFRRIHVAPLNEDFLFKDSPNINIDDHWKVSTASIVDSIVGLISKNPKKDLNKLRQLDHNKRKRETLDFYKDVPLRKYYIEYNDLLIYQIIKNFFIAINDCIFSKINDKSSYIKKTVGIQALFLALKEILANELEDKRDVSIRYFSDKVKSISTIDFNDNFFTASGIGKTRIKNVLLIQLKYRSIKDIKKEEDVGHYERILKSKP